MKYIKKGKEPKELTYYRNSGETWDDFSLDKGKREVKEQLLFEQNSRCAYCTAAISFASMKVEHWCSRKKCPINRNLDYSNLLGVCLGCYNDGEYFHCDTSKDETLIEITPLNQNHIRTISYQNDGKIISSNITFQNEINNTLCLNIAPLQKKRRTLLRELKLKLNIKYLKRKANYGKELSNIKKANIPFNDILVKYLEQKIRKSE